MEETDFDIETYVPLVKLVTRKFLSTLTSEQDLFQEGMIAYMRATQTFDPTRDAKLETYATRVITNRFIDLLRRQNPDADTKIDHERTESDFSMEDQMNLIEIKKILATKVGEIERAIFKSYIEGFSYEEISAIFDQPRKKIDNTVQKVKQTIRANM